MGSLELGDSVRGCSVCAGTSANCRSVRSCWNPGMSPGARSPYVGTPHESSLPVAERTDTVEEEACRIWAWGLLPGCQLWFCIGELLRADQSCLLLCASISRLGKLVLPPIYLVPAAINPLGSLRQNQSVAWAMGMGPGDPSPFPSSEPQFPKAKGQWVRGGDQKGWSVWGHPCSRLWTLPPPTPSLHL